MGQGQEVHARKLIQMSMVQVTTGNVLFSWVLIFFQEKCFVFEKGYSPLLTDLRITLIQLNSSIIMPRSQKIKFITWVITPKNYHFPQLTIAVLL